MVIWRLTRERYDPDDPGTITHSRWTDHPTWREAWETGTTGIPDDVRTIQAGVKHRDRFIPGHFSAGATLTANRGRTGWTTNENVDSWWLQHHHEIDKL